MMERFEHHESSMIGKLGRPIMLSTVRRQQKLPRAEARMRYLILAPLLALISAAACGDDFKIIKLEQDVRNLERQVSVLSRQIDDLRMQLSRSGDRPVSARPTTAVSSSSDWLLASNWARVRAGMGELEVIDALGPPTSMRVDDDARVLLYALEIGTGAFLSGSVTLKERRVVDVERPTLK
jgi:hypothetical protein